MLSSSQAHKELSNLLQIGSCDHRIYQQLFTLSEQLHPFLKQTEIDINQSLYYLDNWHNSASSKALCSVYEHLQCAHPEAGKVYWAHKCWQLAIWQPILLSFICIYGLNVSLPISKLTVHCHQSTIAGYQLSCHEVYTGDSTAIITHISAQCLSLIDNYYQQINAFCNLKRRFCRRLLNDQLLAALANVPHFIPSLSNNQLNQHRTLWLQGFKLPDKAIEYTNTGEIRRSSCCLEYRLTSGQYCSNCPKENAKQNVTT